MEQKLMNIREVSDALGVSKSTIRSWVYQHRIPVVRLGTAVRISSVWLEDAMKNGLQ